MINKQFSAVFIISAVFSHFLYFQPHCFVYMVGVLAIVFSRFFTHTNGFDNISYDNCLLELPYSLVDPIYNQIGLRIIYFGKCAHIEHARYCMLPFRILIYITKLIFQPDWWFFHPDWLNWCFFTRIYETFNRIAKISSGFPKI